jgi:MHS family metabolite:H+ symporter-like MFS transporter
VDTTSDDPGYAANLRRATLASSIGSALEYFDFALYGLSTALIFNVLFFSQDDPAMATVAAFATFGVGFVARPFGGCSSARSATVSAASGCSSSRSS